MNPIAVWTIKGYEDREYTFDVYSIDDEFPNVGGAYILSKRTEKDDNTGVHKVLYAGRTDVINSDLKKTDEKWIISIQRGANAISIYPSDEFISKVVLEEITDILKPSLKY